MSKIERQQYKKEQKEEQLYTARDFFEIKAELEKYSIDKELPTIDKKSREMVHFVPVEGIQKWLIEKGALSNVSEWTVKDIPLFKELQNKLFQYNNWNRKREYAQKKQLEGYTDVVDSMKVVIDDIPF